MHLVEGREETLTVFKLDKMKINFYTTKPRSVQGFNVGRQMLAAPRGDPMQVSEKHLEFMMTKVFTFPRNTQFDKVRVEEKLKSISIMSLYSL